MKYIKKYKALVIGVLIFGLNCSNAYAFVDYTQQINTDFTSMLDVPIHNVHMCGECRPYNDLTEIYDSGVNANQKKEIDKMIVDLIPRGLIDSFRYSGNRLILTSKDIRTVNGSNFDFEPSGTYNSTKKELFLSNKNNNKWGRDSLVHEFGHYLDYLLVSVLNTSSRLSKTPEFMSVWESERLNLKVDYLSNLSYYQDSVTEYFAQVFSEYIKNPNRLKANTPKTYEYMKKCMLIVELSTSSTH